jgi:hypothetical protein
MGLLLLTGRPAMQKRLGSSIILETKQAAATRKNSAAQRVCFRCVAMPRNESQQFRPAGTRVALPGANYRSSQSESSVQDFFRRLRKREKCVLLIFAKRKTVRKILVKLQPEQCRG